ncbi:antibiotic biosynthesis monooxygenase family protein [Nocardiopsis alba]|uniref:antibiotic biosynthesis monooxygenase family protein n=1 Tax=Nocardiopsis alba TaxID=53437 RepID=UPI0035DCFB2D
MSGTVRVVVHHRAPEGEWTTVREAYDTISGQLEGTPGLLGNELLRSTLDPRSFAVLSRWKDLDAFTEWERGSGHRGTTSPLRRFQDRDRTPHFEVYEVDAAW